MTNWGVFERWTEDGENTDFLDVAPLVRIDGLEMMSAPHTPGKSCLCRPLFEVSEHGTIIWIHHDPDHPGALSAPEWVKKMATQVPQ